MQVMCACMCIPYSSKFSRAKNFEIFADFDLFSKIKTSKKLTTCKMALFKYFKKTALPTPNGTVADDSSSHFKDAAKGLLPKLRPSFNENLF